MRIVAARLRVSDDGTRPISNGDIHLAADAALICLRGNTVPEMVRTRMMDTLERLGSAETGS